MSSAPEMELYWSAYQLWYLVIAEQPPSGVHVRHVLMAEQLQGGEHRRGGRVGLDRHSGDIGGRTRTNSEDAYPRP